jgi:hypothetical protein
MRGQLNNPNCVGPGTRQIFPCGALQGNWGPSPRQTTTRLPVKAPLWPKWPRVYRVNRCTHVPPGEGRDPWRAISVWDTHVTLGEGRDPWEPITTPPPPLPLPLTFQRTSDTDFVHVHRYSKYTFTNKAPLCPQWTRVYRVNLCTHVRCGFWLLNCGYSITCRFDSKSADNT